jgi:cytochrome c-type biogenesis protein CcmH
MSPTIAVIAGIGLLALLALASSLLLRSRGAAPVPAWRQLLALLLAVGLPFGAAGYYFDTQKPPPTPAAGPHSEAELAAGAASLAAQLAQQPGDADGWVLLARSYARLERYAEAQGAMAKALALRPDDTALHAQLGEILVLGADGVVTAAAEAEFAKAPADPRARYYRGLGLAQQGDTEGGRHALQALLDDSAPDAPWRQGVIDALADLGAPPPTDRQAMIRSMVERLAQRLEEHPDDPEGWDRLAHSYEVLGEPEKAAAARARKPKP